MAKVLNATAKLRYFRIVYGLQVKQVVGLVTYNTTILPIVRTGRVMDPKRGNSSYSTWNYEEALKRNDPKTIAGDVSVDEIYERITYLLDRLMPVAKEYNVKLGNHIADPPLPAGYRGITRWNSPDVFEGIKRFAQLYDSSHHGFLLCLGSVAEGLKDPKTEILPIIKWVGERNQIFNVHLRNIKGGWNNFMEVYPDNGDMDFLQIIRALRDVGYSGMVCPDHVPYHPDPASSLQGFAFAYGYIKALIHAAEIGSINLVIPARLERATHSLEGCCSIQLSYGTKNILTNARPSRPEVGMLYPTELRNHVQRAKIHFF